MDDLKISHASKTITELIISELQTCYRKETLHVVHCRKIHNYLRMMIDYLVPRKVHFSVQDLTLTFEADTMSHICWWINASFAVHWDYKSHTGTTMSFETGSVLSSYTKQKINTFSLIMETELVRGNDPMSLVLWFCSFL